MSLVGYLVHLALFVLVLSGSVVVNWSLLVHFFFSDAADVLVVVGVLLELGLLSRLLL